MEAQWSVMEALRRSDSENDPQLGPQLMEREVDRLESEVARLKEKLFKAEDKIAEMERETEHRYVKMKGDVVENSMQLLHGFQRSHIDAQDMSTRRIAFLETELDQANKELARFSDVRRELLKKQAECKELSEALEELELQHRAQKEAKTGVVRAQSADTVVALLSQELLVQVARERKRAEQAEAALETEKLDREEFEALVQEELQRLQDEKQRSQDDKHQSDARIEEMKISIQQYRESLQQHQESLRHRDASMVERITEYSLALEEERQTCNGLEQTCNGLEQKMQLLQLNLNNLQKENDMFRSLYSSPRLRPLGEAARSLGVWLSRAGKCGCGIFSGKHSGSFPRAAACL